MTAFGHVLNYRKSLKWDNFSSLSVKKNRWKMVPILSFFKVIKPLRVGITSENRNISRFLRSYRDMNHNLRQTLITGAFVGGEFSQSKLFSTPSAIERHASIDRPQTQHEHLQLLMIH